MAISKVVFGDSTLIDITDTTATSSDVQSGKFFYNSAGVKLEGTAVAIEPATSTPLMDGTAAVGTSTKYAREDHVHPVDTSRASASDVSNLYFTSVAVSATTGDIATVNNSRITSNHVVVSIVFANPSAVSDSVTWTTASGSLTLNGACTAATTANIVLIKKNN